MIHSRLLSYAKAALPAAFLFLSTLGLAPFCAVDSYAAPKKTSAVKRSNKASNNKQMPASFENPDFAFPETVEKNASEQLARALANRSGADALKAAMQLIVARNEVSNSAFNENVAMLDTLSAQLPQPYSAISTLLEANLYSQYYEASPWIYNGRVLPLDSYPSDPSAWSGDLFAQKVLELVETATSSPEAAKATSIKDIEDILSDTEFAIASDLSVYDFIIGNATGLLSTFGSSDVATVIPFTSDAVQQPNNVREKCALKQCELANELLEWRRSGNNHLALAKAVWLKAMTMNGSEKLRFVEQWMETLIHTEAGAPMLQLYYITLNGQPDGLTPNARRDLYHLMKTYIGEFPSSQFTPAVKYMLAQQESKSAKVSLPSAVLPGKDIKVKVTGENMNSAYILLYRVPENIVPMNSLNAKEFPGKATFVKAVPVSFEGTIPFSAETEVSLGQLTPGYYVAVPSATSKLSSNWKKEVGAWALGVMNVSDIAVVTSFDSGTRDSGRVYVVDASNQRPIAGAVVSFYSSDGRNSKPIHKATTDESGVVDMKEGFYRMRASFESSVVWEYCDAHYSERKETETFNARILTDLSVYKPGEKVGFSVVSWSGKGHEASLLVDTDVNVVMRDANWNAVDTLSLKTDKWGRCDGSFRVPADGLLGRYSLNVSFPQKKYASQVASASFQVADYKAPGFFVSVESVGDGEYEPGSVIRFKGEVKTWSGMPLNDAAVNYTVRWNPWWRWWDGGDSNASYGATAVTDPDGKFDIELPTANLKGTRFERGIFTLTASVTSQAGETQTSPDLRFALGEALSVRPSFGDKIEVKGDTVKFNVPVYDMLDHPVNKPVAYSIINVADGKRVAGGSFRSPILRVPSRILPSGEYKLTFNVAPDTTTTTMQTVLWRQNDEKVPCVTPLWIPEQEVIVADGEGKAKVTFGSSYPDSWILCQVADEKGILSRKWYPVGGRNRVIEVEAPENGSRRWVTFSGMHDLEKSIKTVTIIPEASTRRMEIKASSFRDKVSAGDKEKWVFEFRVKDELQKEIPAMAVLSNKALNVVANFNWNFSLSTLGWWNRTRLSSNSVRNSSISGNFSVLPKYSDINLSLPTWQTYGYPLAGGATSGMLRIRGTRMMKSEFASDDSVMEPEAVENQVLMATASPKSLAMAGNSSQTYDLAIEEEAAVEDMDGAEADVTVASGSGSNESMRPRPVEMPLAFFMPSLLSDADGNVNVEFEVPNFNTTWQFQIAGYNRELLSAALTLDAVASKPVMVQVNPPRYLRTGDKAQITATLFNNSAEDAMLHGEIVIYDPSTGETIISRHLGAALTPPAGNRTISIEFPVATNISLLGIRAYAYSGNFSDGEQTVIPVLPSSTPVVEATQFYLGTGAGNFAVKLPKYRKDAALTLRYCDNPIWECVLALPDITVPDSKNILSLVRSLYANSLASGIVTKYPAVKSGLEKALAAAKKGESTILKSNLEKDASLKTVALNNTPWVNTAASETRRMENLSTLIEDGKASSACESIMQDIKDLQNSDGGWSWCSRMPSSSFMTENVILNFGLMREAGVLPSSAPGMIKKAISYCDRKAVEDYERNDHRFSTVSMLRYLYARSFFDDGNGPSGFGRLKSEALTKIKEEWKGMSIYDKATASILFGRTKGYGTEVAPILESLSQLASKSESKGWWYDNLYGGWDGMPKLATTARALEAFAAAGGHNEAVDGLRQWLVLQKETENWGANPYTVGVIQAILSSGTDWTSNQESTVKIKVGNKPVNIPSAEMLTGIVTLTLDPSSVSGKELKVEKSSEGPAWGGVVSQYIAPMNEVKAESCENLSVTKQLMVIKDGSAGPKASELGKGMLKIGDKVRVTLTLTCGKDMNYVALIDERAACLEPVDQLSGYSVTDGMALYREVRDNKTSFFINYLPKGVNVITYDCYVDRNGIYSAGIASAQSQYSPLQAAHSAGAVITVE